MPTRSSAQILGAFGEAIEPVRPAFFYRLWIVIVAAVMALLVACYVAIIAAVACAVLWHAVYNLRVFRDTSPRSIKGAVLIYFFPLLAGAGLIAFLLKPLFARPRQTKQRLFDPSQEPLLFAFVDGVCQSVGSPRPRRVQVDWRANASASFEGGPFGLQRQLVLTIGLSLAGGLSLKQFAGVLAHEFGHFSQSAGMGLHYLIRTINEWFARVVYERDSWDEQLLEWSQSGNNVESLFAWFARGLIWLTRRILWVLMVLGNAASSVLSRLMEYDADRYEARMVGGATFAQTMLILGEMALAEHAALNSLAESWREHRLPDNFTKLMLAELQKIPPEARQTLRAALDKRGTKLLDTHPAPGQRIALAHAEAAEGIFRLEGPATDLFEDFDELCKTVSLDLYRMVAGPQITAEELFPVAEMLHGQVVAKEGQDALERFFVDNFSQMQALPLPADQPTAPPDLAVATRALEEARDQMLAARAGDSNAKKEWSAALGQWVAADAAVILLKTGNKIKPSDYGLAAPKMEVAKAAAGRAEAAWRESREKSRAFETSAARRLTLALCLLESEGVAARVTEGPVLCAEARALYPSTALLAGRIIPELCDLFLVHQVAVKLVGRLQQHSKTRDEALINACLRASGELQQQLQHLQGKLGGNVLYPFDHAQERISLGGFALPSLPADPQALGDVMRTCEEAMEKLATTYRRLLGRLAVAAEEVERALGLEPLQAAPAEAETVA
jgi:hypothetical protein